MAVIRGLFLLLALAITLAVAWFCYVYFSAPTTFPDGSIGKIDRFDTQVQHCQNQSSDCEVVSAETSFFSDARLVTNETGRLRAVLVDETVFALGPQTDFVVDEFVYKPRTFGTFLVALTTGSFRMVSGSSGKTYVSEISVDTTVGSIGVRGTDFVVRQLDGAMDVVLIDGEVEVSNLAGSVTLRALGDYAVVYDQNTPPILRTGLSHGQMIELLSATTFDDELDALAVPGSDYQMGER